MTISLEECLKSKDLLDNILKSSIKYSIIGKDLDGTIVFWNQGAENNYGYTAEEIMGKNANILHTPEDVQSGKVKNLLQITLEKGIAEGQFERVRKNGSRFTADVVITRRDDAHGKPIGYLLMSNDVTQRVKLETYAKVSAAASVVMIAVMITTITLLLLR